LKVKVELVLRGVYNDGAGNSCVYAYNVNSGTEITLLNTDFWKLLWFAIAPPAVGTTYTAYGISASVGAPPAFATRDLVVSSTGVLTWTDTDETFDHLWIKLTLVEAPDHEYEVWDFVNILEALGKYEKILITLPVAGATTFTNPAEDIIVEDSAEWGLASHYVVWEFHPSATEQARNRLCTPTIGVVEGDLMSRPYDGMLIEAGIKAINLMVKAKKGANKMLGVVAAEIGGYMAGDSPFDVLIPQVTKTVRLV
jgi:hypothetical protein